MRYQGAMVSKEGNKNCHLTKISFLDTSVSGSIISSMLYSSVVPIEILFLHNERLHPLCIVLLISRINRYPR